MRKETAERLQKIKQSVIYRDLCLSLGKDIAESECRTLAFTDLNINFDAALLRGSFQWEKAPHGYDYWRSVARLARKNEKRNAKIMRSFFGIILFFIGGSVGVLCLALGL